MLSCTRGHVSARPTDEEQQARPLARQSAAERAARHRKVAERAAQRRSADAVIAVTWDPRLRRPVVFVWRGSRFRVERVVREWVAAVGWWSEEAQINRHYWRVRTDGRLFDLSFDRITKVWRLEHVLN
jgi:hypothetical protein